jgi:hypothetical protein
MEQTTKIVGGLSEFKEDKKQTRGLLQRLEEAKTEQEIEYLIGVGKTYKNVSTGTMKKWIRAATKRGTKLYMDKS